MGNAATAHRNAWGLTILSLLYERDMHPYEMRRLVRDRAKDEHRELRPGSLYRSIDRLQSLGLIEVVETSREGRFPERTVYRITDEGRDELREWLRDLLSRPRKDLPELVDALNYAAVLTPEELRWELERRVLWLEREIAGSEATAHAIAGWLPAILHIENEYARAMRRAELDWVRGVVARLRSGELRWSGEELRAIAEHPSPRSMPDPTTMDTPSPGGLQR